MNKDRFALNRELKAHGLASLDEAGALTAQLAFLVHDDRHFASLLNACEPAERRSMYEAMAPNLRFKARPLAEYLIESAQDAERRQLPTIGPGGELVPFKVPEIETPARLDDALATAAAAIAKEHLAVVCTLCTREQAVSAITREDAVRELRRLGWRYAFKNSLVDPNRDPERVEVCPACVKARAPRLVTA
jgi:hypothetical protein